MLNWQLGVCANRVLGLSGLASLCMPWYHPLLLWLRGACSGRFDGACPGALGLARGRAGPVGACGGGASGPWFITDFGTANGSPAVPNS